MFRQSHGCSYSPPAQSASAAAGASSTAPPAHLPAHGKNAAFKFELWRPLPSRQWKTAKAQLLLCFSGCDHRVVAGGHWHQQPATATGRCATRRRLGAYSSVSMVLQQTVRTGSDDGQDAQRSAPDPAAGASAARAGCGTAGWGNIRRAPPRRSPTAGPTPPAGTPALRDLRLSVENFQSELARELVSHWHRRWAAVPNLVTRSASWQSRSVGAVVNSSVLTGNAAPTVVSPPACHTQFRRNTLGFR